MQNQKTKTIEGNMKLTKIKINKPPNHYSHRSIYYILVVAVIFLTILTINDKTTNVILAEEISRECLDECGESCDMIRPNNRIKCYSVCLAKCLR